jgi:outer membrane lipoprotein-sorting protein
MAGSRFNRWGAPPLVALGVAAASLAPHAWAASGHPNLAPMTAAQLLAAVRDSKVEALSGTVRTVARLGLPQVPDRLVTVGSGLPALLTGTHNLRVWADGKDRQRVALLGDLTETDLVHNGADVWTYASSSNAVTHRTLPAHAGAPDASAGTDTTELTPQAQAERALKAIDPTTTVSVDDTARVAGRPAYQLTLTPRTTDTLVRSVRIAIDSATSVPTRVELYADGSSPAWSTEFTDVTFAAPAAKIFDFSPPAGAAVSDAAKPGTAEPAPNGEAAKDTAKPTTTGTGWTTVLELPAGTLDTASLGAGKDGQGEDRRSPWDRLTTQVPEGRLLTTRLLSVLIAPDGRVLLGAVPPAVVRKAAAGA